MNENELARTMDELIQLAGGNTPSGLRAIGATAWGPLARLHRFVQTTIRQVAPASPELATLHESLQLFIDGFVPAGGFRLLRVARPSVLNYGLYGPSRITAAELRLIDLVNRRGALARELDCLTDCACDDQTVLAQIVLDKLLYDVDRAIDYYCVGDADLGLPEVRASAYSHLIDAVVSPFAWPWNRPPNVPQPPFIAQIPAAVTAELTAIRGLLRPLGAAPGWDTTTAVYNADLNGNLAWLGGASTTLRFAQVVHDELCLQRDTDQQWRALIEQMTTGCVPADWIFRDAADAAEGVLPLVVDRALNVIEAATAGAVDAQGHSLQVGGVCVQAETIVPPHFEQSLEDIVANTAP
jgi:hypothetical protein